MTEETLTEAREVMLFPLEAEAEEVVDAAERGEATEVWTTDTICAKI
jgi:hypothetical protein